MHLVLLYCYRCLAFYLSYLTKLHLPELARLPTPPDILIHPFQRGTLPPALLRSAGLRVISWFSYISFRAVYLFLPLHPPPLSHCCLSYLLRDEFVVHVRCGVILLVAIGLMSVQLKLGFL